MWRYRITFFLFVFSFCFVIARLFYWQVVKAEELSSWGQSQYGKNVTLLPVRGEIKTSDGYPIATNKLSYLVFANPKEIKNSEKEALSLVLSKHLEVDSATLSAKLSQDLFWVTLKTSISSTKKQEVEKLNLPGIGFEEQGARFYPEASMAAQLIGFVAKNEIGENKGYFGLEGYYDRQLRGKEGIGVQIDDAYGRPILAKLNNSTKPIDGRTLQLSIDRTIQFIAEKKLKAGIETYGASGGMIVILDPKTGNILAMTSFPSFDERSFWKYSDDLYKNPIISNTYEPGSTFKPLIMASALDEGVVKPETECDICDGPVTIGGYTIRTWNDKYYKNINMIDVIQHSDNTGMVFVAQKLGLNRLLSHAKAFGFGEITGIDLQGEVASMLRPADSWYPIDVATAGFGQGISITPMQLLTAFSALANNGSRMEPHVVSKIITSDETIIDIESKVLDHPVSSNTAKVMTEILVNAVDKGEAKWVKPKGYRIAGKTGTAQIPIAGHYDPNKTIASFIGYAPADNPKFAMLVVIDRPTTSVYGAETAAPVFFDIAKDLFAYYGIAPSE